MTRTNMKAWSKQAHARSRNYTAPIVIWDRNSHPETKALLQEQGMTMSTVVPLNRRARPLDELLGYQMPCRQQGRTNTHDFGNGRRGNPRSMGRSALLAEMHDLLTRVVASVLTRTGVDVKKVRGTLAIGSWRAGTHSATFTT
jgi:hypothetical protein